MEDITILGTNSENVNEEGIAFLNNCVKEICLNVDDISKYRKLIEKYFPDEPDLYAKVNTLVTTIKELVGKDKLTQTKVSNIKFLANEVYVTDQTIDEIISKILPIPFRPKKKNIRGIWIVLSVLGVIALCYYYFYHYNEDTPESSSYEHIDKEDEYEYGKVLDEDGYTNVRESGSMDAPIVSKLKDGSRLKFKKVSDSQWFKVYSLNDDYYGYMHNSKIIRTYRNDLVKGRIVDEGGYTNVRERPTMESSIISNIQDGSLLLFYPSSNSWYKVFNLKGEYLGYMHSSKIENY